MQELCRHRRRNTATGRTSLFSGLVYCADCGSKLYFCASKSIKPNQEFHRCSAYKENRGTCSLHRRIISFRCYDLVGGGVLDVTYK
ncbi:MAG: zinc ribbon domain-containing protein [Oscillospiraceae bacterium]|nr:zinc ribbon domain-containing protein [Oscillospiraceae bacterium]